MVVSWFCVAATFWVASLWSPDGLLVVVVVVLVVDVVVLDHRLGMTLVWFVQLS